MVVPIQNQQIAIAQSPTIALSQPAYAPQRIIQGPTLFRNALAKVSHYRYGFSCILKFRELSLTRRCRELLVFLSYSLQLMSCKSFNRRLPDLQEQPPSYLQLEGNFFPMILRCYSIDQLAYSCYSLVVGADLLIVSMRICERFYKSLLRSTFALVFV